MTQLENLSGALSPERVPLKGMRKMIAAKMLESLQTTAQLTHHAECRLDALKARRAELKAAGSAVSVQDLVLLKVIETLKAHPGLNATLADEVIHHHAAVHLGLAIPLPGHLLVAPALFNAEQLDGEELCQARKALVDKALASKLSVKELTGATFTVSNLGLSRVHHFTPVLNPPQVAILGIGGVQRRLELSASGALVEAEWLGLSLTFDHRAVNGAPAADFLDDLCRRIEEGAA
ncbi:2-oxo acid dehydrogenase subunit E2 [Stutzerimonas stutzeri]|jgi:pyruvate/2-oxoglutarate dehydrogenase complex dihydrolipoamide acyltransferase (E2) component|uniref:2-oxo acid dehydrogenase subunit E2 n=1 Tax=Stutzerimonas stutzeri TaxID=316 RepID=UPI000D20DB56|nr:2-oxo acid dehydrogenase subunit E2 [Stutzerimonas stutzeri]MBW8338366.1 2-oxo acid dehydrogenase subunit E2 [Pseudomonas sp.]AVX13986.1 2-oxo acid dehydrogenase subunit E2 [Stutzerimonas stutzeri]MBH3353316.1 2-oxo acid dehydrogenase subunit E2 [Stutzerimonas stutzeri]MDH0056043.1 2-oxo acid dehydrogenase subunit E2 [Stutzerimonas stutzeri]MDH0082005.1 2-oxo acid dehydrogenase subunit E2 [Stutzerimonas stutzeri]